MDVAAAGGWSDIGTLMKCYQQADDVTLLEVMSYSKKISGGARGGLTQGRNSPPTQDNKKPPQRKALQGLVSRSRGDWI